MMQDFAMGMGAMFYDVWFREDVSPNLTDGQKEILLKKIMDLSLKRAFWLDKDIPLNDFPELKPYAHTENFSGTQLYAVMIAIFNELHPNVMPKPYPEFLITKRGGG